MYACMYVCMYVYTTVIIIIVVDTVHRVWVNSFRRGEEDDQADIFSIIVRKTQTPATGAKALGHHNKPRNSMRLDIQNICTRVQGYSKVDCCYFDVRKSTIH